MVVLDTVEARDVDRAFDEGRPVNATADVIVLLVLSCWFPGPVGCAVGAPNVKGRTAEGFAVALVEDTGIAGWLAGCGNAG